MQMELVLRFDYGKSVPLVTNTADGVRALAGHDEVLVHTPVPTHGDNLKTIARFAISKGETLPFVLTRNDSGVPLPWEKDPLRLLDDTEAFWQQWISKCKYEGPFRKQVIRSLITLKALIPFLPHSELMM
jgi:GH15 family glucan-1,4-alpha-glucosidase